jgi:hypothetical protein
LPYLSAIPGIIFVIITFSRLLGVSPLFKRLRPKWTKPFVDEYPTPKDEPHSRSSLSLSWTIALFVLSVLAVAAQAVKFTFSEIQVHAILLLLSWTGALLFILLTRPSSGPTSLLAYYISVLVIEGSSIDNWAFPPSLIITTHHIGIFTAFMSIVVILMMPMRSALLSTDSISKAGTVPSETERSPEDNLRLWQFLSISWIAPLIEIGNKQQVEESNVWLLGYQFQHRRLHEAFCVLRGTVTRRLLQANGIDVCILTFTAFIQLLCGN